MCQTNGTATGSNTLSLFTAMASRNLRCAYIALGQVLPPTPPPPPSLSPSLHTPFFSNGHTLISFTNCYISVCNFSTQPRAQIDPNLSIYSQQRAVSLVRLCRTHSAEEVITEIVLNLAEGGRWWFLCPFCDVVS